MTDYEKSQELRTRLACAAANVPREQWDYEPSRTKLYYYSLIDNLLLICEKAGVVLEAR
jgi:hypothetical protein